MAGTPEQDERIAAAIVQEQARLRSFIRRRLPDAGDVEDVLQDVFYELVVAYRLMKPIRQVSSWLLRVAQNRITDRFRRKKPEPLLAGDSLPSAVATPDDQLHQARLSRDLAVALAALPPEQRHVFVAHELEDRSFAELAAETGVNVNTLLSRKHAAVRQLRRRLRPTQAEYLWNAGTR